MDIDADRWLALLDALRDAEAESPPVVDLQNANAALSRARADLEHHRSRGPTGRIDQRQTPEVLATAHARDVAELEQRVATREREAKRIDARIKAASAKRNTLFQLVEGVRAQARLEGILLPGDDSLQPPPMFSSTSVQVPGAPADARSFMTPQPARGNGAGSPPASRTVGGIARGMVERIFS